MAKGKASDTDNVVCRALVYVAPWATFGISVPAVQDEVDLTIAI